MMEETTTARGKEPHATHAWKTWELFVGIVPAQYGLVALFHRERASFSYQRETDWLIASIPTRFLDFLPASLEFAESQLC